MMDVLPALGDNDEFSIGYYREEDLGFSPLPAKSTRPPTTRFFLLLLAAWVPYPEPRVHAPLSPTEDRHSLPEAGLSRNHGFPDTTIFAACPQGIESSTFLTQTFRWRRSGSPPGLAALGQWRSHTSALHSFDLCRRFVRGPFLLSFANDARHLWRRAPARRRSRWALRFMRRGARVSHGVAAVKKRDHLSSFLFFWFV